MLQLNRIVGVVYAVMEVTCGGVVHLVCGNLQHKQHILFHDLEFIMYANMIATCSCQCGAYLSVIG